MIVIASYFEPDKAAVAAEALCKTAIEFKQATRVKDSLDSVTLPDREKAPNHFPARSGSVSVELSGADQDRADGHQ